MAIILVALLIVIIFGALGFALHVLWWLALVALAIWLLGFVVRIGETVAAPRRRWYSPSTPRRRWYYW
jgi:membrane protein YdbS with pleckstrin-like domain